METQWQTSIWNTEKEMGGQHEDEDYGYSLWGWEVEGTGFGPYPMQGYRISSVEPSGFANRASIPI
jgi:hypothetical protein